MLKVQKFNFSSPRFSSPLNNKHVILFAIENNTSESKEMRKCGVSNVDIALME